jgi:preprotein translocase subunit SecG
VSAIVQVQPQPSQRSALLWLAPVQAAAAFTVLATISRGQTLRAWLLSAVVWVMALPLLVSLEAGLVAMMLFEPVRGLLRRAQYLLVDYTSQDPIHVLTPIVTLLAFALLLKSQRFGIFRASPLAGWVSLLGLMYLVQIFNPLQGGLLVGLAGAMFTLVPLLWFYFGQSVNDEFITKVLRLMVVVAVVTSIYGVYQLLFGYPAFEQYWIDHTEFYDSIAVGRVERALATFCSAEEWGRYTELGAIVAFGFAAGAKRLQVRAGWIFSAVALSGFVLLSGQRAAVFGLIVGVAALLLLGARSLPNAMARVALLLVPALLLVVFLKAPAQEEMWGNDETQTVTTVLSHTQRGVLKPAEEESLQVRLTNWSYFLTQVVPYRPLGAGIGASWLSQARFNQDVDFPPVDSSILSHAITCGIPGILLFVWILSRATWFSFRAARRAQPDDRNASTKRIVAAVMCALILNSVFGLTFTLYSVAPLAWLFIGWISAEALRARREGERETMVI